MEMEVELTLRKGNGAYVADLRARQSEDNELRAGPFLFVIDPAELANLEQEPERYGQALSDALFQENGLVWALGMTYGIARGLNHRLRMRLLIDRSAPELDLLRWELLRIPGSTECLSTRDDILFSRYAPKRRDPPPPRPAAKLRALVAVSDPKGAHKKGHLAPLAEAFNKQFFVESLSGIAVDFLPDAPGEHCTLDLLAGRAAGHDILILMAHSKQTAKGWHVLLQDSAGKTRAVRVERLCARLQALRELPRLVLLLGDDSAAVAASLMNELGIPAVIGIHGPMLQETAWLFLPALFDALRLDGAIDHAVASARRAIGENCEDWPPVLYTSLTSGILWRDLLPADPARPVVAGAPAAASPPKPAGGAAVAVPADPNAPDRKALYALLAGPAFDLEGIEELCFFLQIEWDSLKGQAQSAKARSLIAYLEKRKRLLELVEEIRRLRPELDL